MHAPPSEQLGADGHIVNEDGDLVLLMAERDRFKNMGHCRLECLGSVTGAHGERIPQVLTLGYCEGKQFRSTFRHGHVMESVDEFPQLASASAAYW